MKIEAYTCGPFATNCYVLLEEAEEACLLVDPAPDCGPVLDRISERGLRVLAVVNTHGHVDHTCQNRPAVERFGAPLLAHEGDLPLLERLPEQAAMFGLDAPASPSPDRLLADGDVVPLGGEALRVLHTPGHSPGGICLLHEGHGDPVVLAGDTLFAGSIGRTDLWGADFEQLARSIREKLYALPDETRVLPGHGPETTIGAERRANPFVPGFSP